MDDNRIAKPLSQQQLPMPVRHDEIDGIEMGVLDDGTPYLTSSGLARICGVARSVIIEMTSDWAEQSTKPRGRKIRELLEYQGYSGDQLAIATEIAGKPTNAHPDGVCMAILEYYAFEGGRETAMDAFRILARFGLRKFIYERVGFRDARKDAWKNFEDLVSMNLAPKGYFSVFQESASLIVTSIRNDLPISAQTIPDISIGQGWAKYWKDNNLEERFGPRESHSHDYPPNYPQSKAKIEASVYPISALGEYRTWFEATYLAEKYPAYLARKRRIGDITDAGYNKLIAAIEAEMDHQLPE